MAENVEVLHPITDYAPDDLGRRLTGLVGERTTNTLLTVRHLLGPLTRYTDTDTAEGSVRRAQDIHSLGVHKIYVVVGDEGDPEGLASIYPALQLRRLRLPIPLGAYDHPAVELMRERSGLVKRLAGRKWWTDLEYANPNLTAWTRFDQEELLAKAYQELDGQVDPSHDNRLERPWTIEPTRSPSYIHEAIGSTSMQHIARRFFDDEESRTQAPPLSRLYARLHSGWWTFHGAMHELETGRGSRFIDNWEAKASTRMTQY